MALVGDIAPQEETGLVLGDTGAVVTAAEEAVFAAAEEAVFAAAEEAVAASAEDNDGDGWVAGEGQDCNDADPSIHPGAPELAYDGRDQDCNGADLVDVDGDGYAGLPVPAGTDCDDGDRTVHPGAPERCDGRDDDCDGSIDEDCASLPDGRPPPGGVWWVCGVAGGQMSAWLPLIAGLFLYWRRNATAVR